MCGFHYVKTKYFTIMYLGNWFCYLLGTGAYYYYYYFFYETLLGIVFETLRYTYLHYTKLQTFMNYSNNTVQTNID